MNAGERRVSEFRTHRYLGLPALVAAWLTIQGPGPDVLRAQSVGQTDKPPAAPRLVLAFYYPWYGNPKVVGGSGRLFHWDRIDEENRQIASSTHYPKLGAYDSHDPELIARHCRWAKQANLDGLIVSWWGKDTFEDQALPRILDGCKEAGLRATIYYETVPAPKNADTATRDILAVLEKYADHPAWLRVEDKPVLFVYGRAIDEIGLDGWKAVIAQVKSRYKKGAVLLGDRLDAAAAGVFDGTHTYNPAGSLRGKSLDQVR
jgi:glycoprotein endo-alpha-1,2-mannosidase